MPSDLYTSEDCDTYVDIEIIDSKSWKKNKHHI